MGKPSCREEGELKKGPWTPEEDKKLMAYIQEHGHGNWRALPDKAGLQRCGKSCRLRWTNYLRPDIKRGKFSLQEEQTIIQLHALLGNRWSAIAAHLPRRTDNDIKNHWNTHIKKRLTRLGIDPVTHKPETHKFASPKDAANLSHMAQWESARLEAEARLARKSKPVAPDRSNQLVQQQVLTSALPHIRKDSRPTQPLFCLDALKAWNGARAKPLSTNENDNGSLLLSALGFASDDLESPTSIFSFPTSTVWSGKAILPYDGDCDDVLKETTENQIPTFQNDVTECTWFGEGSFSAENGSVFIPNHVPQNFGNLMVDNDVIIAETSLTAGDNTEVKRNYSSSMLVDASQLFSSCLDNLV